MCSVLFEVLAFNILQNCIPVRKVFNSSVLRPLVGFFSTRIFSYVVPLKTSTAVRISRDLK